MPDASGSRASSSSRIPARSPDTTPEAEDVQVALIRAAPIGRRLQLALSFSAAVIGSARQALARLQPDASPRALALRFVEMHYGADVAEQLRTDLERRDRETGGQ